MEKVILVVVIMIAYSCVNESSSKHYKNLDEFTGGYNDFLLDLESNGDLRLFIKSYKTVSDSAIGNYAESRSKVLTGKWGLNNGIVDYRLNESRSAIDSFYFDTDFANTFKDKQILSFSRELDTAYILGIPCIITGCETEILNTNNLYNDTLKVKFIQGVVFDTTAILVIGHVIDKVTDNPIRNVSVTLKHEQIQFITTTDSIGEFKFHKNLSSGPWSIELTHPRYNCLIVNDAIQTGGQWISFRMTHK
jgi:hypothetical protein